MRFNRIYRGVESKLRLCGNPGLMLVISGRVLNKKPVYVSINAARHTRNINIIS